MTKTYLTWGALILGTIGLVVLLTWAGTNSTTSPATGGQLLSDPVTSEDISKGNPEAPVTLVEYADFQCPACASYASFVNQLTTDLGDNIRVVFRHFPLRSIHPNAQMASQAAEAAQAQGKFWEMHDKLYEKQQQWSNLSNKEAQTFFIDLAKELELDEGQFATDMTSDAARDKVNTDYDSGIASNIQGTPTFFVNGKQIPNPSSYDALKRLLEDVKPE